MWAVANIHGATPFLLPPDLERWNEPFASLYWCLAGTKGWMRKHFWKPTIPKLSQLIWLSLALENLLMLQLKDWKCNLKFSLEIESGSLVPLPKNSCAWSSDHLQKRALAKSEACLDWKLWWWTWCHLDFVFPLFLHTPWELSPLQAQCHRRLLGWARTQKATVVSDWTLLHHGLAMFLDEKIQSAFLFVCLCYVEQEIEHVFVAPKVRPRVESEV